MRGLRCHLSGTLTLFEVEGYVKGLQRFPLTEVGSDAWSKQHEHLEALNLQAHADAQASKHDEVVVEQFASNPDSLATLVYDLLVIEAWKEKVFPLLLDHFSPVTAVKAYIVLYHEATICNLLEVLLYHASTCEAAGGADDALLELGDYCVRKVNLLNAGAFKKLQEDKTEDPKAALNRSTQDVRANSATCNDMQLNASADAHNSALLVLLLHRACVSNRWTSVFPSPCVRQACCVSSPIT